MFRRFGAHIAVVVLAGGGLIAEKAYAEAAAADDSPAHARPAEPAALQPDQAARRHERLRARRNAHRPKRHRAHGAKHPKPGVPAHPAVPQAVLDRIAACESHGDPHAIGGGGAYRGKYQFDYGTWASIGGTGDPAAAPEAEQDARAAILYARTGGSAWPVCA